MKNYPANPVIFAVGLPALSIALICENMSLSSGNYRAVLSVSAVASILAAVLFAAVFVRGSLVWRFASVVAAIPLVFILADFCRRAPYVFDS